MKEELDLDTLVGSWLEAQLLARMDASMKVMDEGPPTPERAAKVIQSMTEVALLESLIKQVKSGTLSAGARTFGLDSVPVSDKTPNFLKNVSEESLQKAVADIERLLGADMTDAANKLRDLGIVDSEEDEATTENETPDLTWSFK